MAGRTKVGSGLRRACGGVLLTMLLLGALLVVAPQAQAGEAPPPLEEPSLVRHSPTYADAFLLAGGYKIWVNAACVAALLDLGAEVTITPWSTFGARDTHLPPPSCEEIAALLGLNNNGPQLLAHSVHYPDAWVLYNGVRYWIPEYCRIDLLAVGVELVITPWAEIVSYPLVPTDVSGCDEVAEMFGVELLSFAAPLFGLGSDPSNGILAIADAGAGIWLSPAEGAATLIPLPGVSDVAYIGGGEWVAVTGEPPENPQGLPGSQSLYIVGQAGPVWVANLLGYEQANNPDGGDIVSNPFSVAVEDENAFVVADAGANAILRVHRDGTVGLVATMPTLDLPNFDPFGPDIPAQSVPTSVVVGPNGSILVGELRGFPGTPLSSFIWHIDPGTSNADCDTSDACTVIGFDFTSIMDLHIGASGVLYVLEFDEAGWLAVEEVGGPVDGGALWVCDGFDQELLCGVLVDELPLATAVEELNGTIFTTVWSLAPDLADVLDIGPAF